MSRLLVGMIGQEATVEEVSSGFATKPRRLICRRLNLAGAPFQGSLLCMWAVSDDDCPEYRFCLGYGGAQGLVWSSIGPAGAAFS